MTWWKDSRGAALRGVTIHERWWDTWPEMKALEHPISGVHMINLDPFQVAADLYLTEGIMAYAFVEQAPRGLSGRRLTEVIRILRLSAAEVHKDKLTSLIIRARDIQEALVETAHPILYAYTEAAIGGELRWGAPANGGFSRKEAWCAWRPIVQHYGPEVAYTNAREDFLSMTTGGVGGEAWAAVADALLTYIRSARDWSAKKLFVDMVLSLEHNCGSLLDKRQWLPIPSRTIRTERLHGELVGELDLDVPGHFAWLLDCHASDPPYVDGLYSCASTEVRQLMTDYREAVEHLGPISSWSG